MTPLPVIGVPVPLAHLDGMDSLLSIVQMPKGIPVATVAVGNATNAGLLAVRILAGADRALRTRMLQYQESLAAMVAEKDARARALRVCAERLTSTRLQVVRSSPCIDYRAYGELRDVPHVVVDGSGQPGTVLVLSHWPGMPTPDALRADLSAEIAFDVPRPPRAPGRRRVRHQQPLRPGRARERVRADAPGRRARRGATA